MERLKVWKRSREEEDRQRKNRLEQNDKEAAEREYHDGRSGRSIGGVPRAKGTHAAGEATKPHEESALSV